jgi:hypothetical protein
MTKYDVDWGGVGVAALLLLLLAAVVCIPIGVGFLLWSVLAPVGFWQVFAGIILVGIITVILYTIEIIVLAIIGALVG